MAILYLASGSAARKKLLEEAGIAFKIVPHCSHETVGEGLPIEKRVLAIARDKMACVDLKDVPTNQSAFVLTADTMISVQHNGKELVLGKPKDLADAHHMIALMRDRDIQVATACCLARQSHKHAAIWTIEKQTAWTTSAICNYVIPQESVDNYFRHVPTALNVCGGCTVEGYGQQFLQKISGSYSAVLGLPMAELREQLTVMGFWSQP
jgi:septum formation protein